MLTASEKSKRYRMKRAGIPIEPLKRGRPPLNKTPADHKLKQLLKELAKHPSLSTELVLEKLLEYKGKTQ